MDIDKGQVKLKQRYIIGNYSLYKRKLDTSKDQRVVYSCYCCFCYPLLSFSLNLFIVVLFILIVIWYREQYECLVQYSNPALYIQATNQIKKVITLKSFNVCGLIYVHNNDNGRLAWAVKANNRQRCKDDKKRKRKIEFHLFTFKLWNNFSPALRQLWT